ncbi:hypothetical protein BKA70DRAFT_670892 [Coprinopsis sp. MPI-PUGE-AT-0042]|nr:hypothetical protein BKA70DRAFT_670892 [Coprinopsis sp. MPI-PUGE-AT-0042]
MFNNSSHITIYGGHFTYVQANSSQIVVTNGMEQSDRSSLGVGDVARCALLEPPDALQRVQHTLQLLRHLVDPSYHHTLRKVHYHLLIVQKMVSVSWEVCRALASTEIGPSVRQSLERTLKRSPEALEEMHKTLALYLHSLVDKKAGLLHTIQSSWDWGVEPGAVLSARLALSTLAESLAEELWSLKRALPTYHKYLSKALKDASMQDLFTSNLNSFLYIKVGQVYVVEPSNGKALAVPIRFIRTYEDLHVFVNMGCSGTAGAPYIEAGQYQLDDASTNMPLTFDLHKPHGLVLEDGLTFEVTLSAKTELMRLDRCPRCHHSAPSQAEIINLEIVEQWERW